MWLISMVLNVLLVSFSKYELNFVYKLSYRICLSNNFMLYISFIEFILQTCNKSHKNKRPNALTELHTARNSINYG